MFFVLAWIALCSYGTYAENQWEEVVHFGRSVPQDKEVGSFIHRAEVKEGGYSVMKHRYLFYGGNCVFSHITVQNLATPTFGSRVFITEGGIGHSEIVIEEHGSVNREYHSDVKLFGYNMFDRNEKCTPHEIVISTGHRNYC